MQTGSPIFDASAWTAVGIIFTAIVAMLNTLVQYKRERRIRDDLVEDRLAAEARADALAKKVEQSAVEARKRSEGVLDAIAENTQVNVDAIAKADAAITVANGHNEKIAAVKEVAATNMEKAANNMDAILDLLRLQEISMRNMDAKIDKQGESLNMLLAERDRGSGV